MKRLQLDTFEALARPVADNSHNSTRRAEDLLELDPPSTRVTPPANALILEVPTQGTNVAHYVQLSRPSQTTHFGHTYTLYPELVCMCTCVFPIMLGITFGNFWSVLRDNPFAPLHLGLVHFQYFLEGPPMPEKK